MPPDPRDAAAPFDSDAAADPSQRDDVDSQRAVSGEIPRVRPRDLLERLSHALRTPISLVVGPLEDALEDADAPLAPAQEARLRLAHRNGLRLVRIVDGILDGPDAVASWAADPPSAEPAPRPPAERRGSRERGRVLVVDDSADMRAYLVQLLSERYEVEEVADGSKALEAAVRCPPDLVLSDVAMPGLDGLSLVRALRAHGATRATCVILLSAEGGADAAHRALDLGADDYVAKPFSPRELLARVAAHVATARIRRDAARREAAAREEADRATRRAAEAEERLLAAVEAERRLALLAEALRGSTWELDVTSRHLRWGEGVAELTGYASDELTDPRGAWIERIHPEDRDRAVSSFEAALAGDATSWADEYRMRHRDGSVVVVSARALIDRDPSGAPLRAIGVAVDLTEQRAAEERLRATQRTEAMGILAAGVAHEVNNMMTAVIGFGELAIRRIEPEGPTHGEVREMLRAARRAHRITEQIASFGKPHGASAEELAIDSVLRDLTSMLSRLLGADIELSLSLPSSPVHARVHRSQLEQVIVDVLLTARDAMPRGGRVTIRMRSIHLDARARAPRAEGRDFALVEIETASSRGAPFGTSIRSGQGLSTAHGIVRHGGGFMELAATGRGICVRLFFPASKAAASDVRGPVAENQTILVVEDEALVRRLTRRILEHAGFRVLEAENGGDALELASAAHDSLGLVVSDLVMPRVGGRELEKLLHDRGLEVPVLFMSAYSGDHIARYELLDPESRFLQKPFAAESLLRAVRSALAQARDGRTAPDARTRLANPHDR